MSGSDRGFFSRAAQWTAEQCGRSWSFLFAVAIVVVWGVLGPVFAYSDTWQLVINTGTTIVTFLMVFLIQHTQNRDSAAIHLKLDELIRTNKDARNALLDLEGLSDEQLNRLKAHFARLSQLGPAVAEIREARADLREAGEKLEDAAVARQ